MRDASSSSGRWPGRLALAAGLCALLAGFPGTAADQEDPRGEPATVEGILGRMDDRMTSDTRSAVARMLIVTPEETREKQFRSFSRGEEDALLVFEKPARERGTKFLEAPATPEHARLFDRHNLRRDIRF